MLPIYRYIFLRMLATLFFSIICNNLAAQYYFNKLTEDNGLSDNRVTCFLKDKKGFLWIGTKNGLNRYDGNEFRVFKPGSGNSISSEVINDIVEDASGEIWVATISGLNSYNPATDTWQTILPDNDGNRNGLPSYIIWNLCVDESNRIWIVSDVWELSVYDPATKKFVYYDWPAVTRLKQFTGLSHYRSIQKILRKNKEEYWLATTIGLFSLHVPSGSFKFYGAGYNTSISDIKYNKASGQVFLVTERGHVFCYDENKRYYQQIYPEPEPYPAMEWNKRKEEMVLMAHPKGMLEINIVRHKATVILHRPGLSSSILPGTINNIYTDNAAMVWVASSSGINYYNGHNQSADFIPLTILPHKENEDGMGSALYDAAGGTYFITSINSNEVFIIDERSGKINSVNSSGGKPFSACTNICSDNQNNVWLLTATNVYRFNKIKKQFTLLVTPNHNKEVIFQDMLQDKNGDYWLGTWLDGLYKYKTKENSFYKFSERDGFYSKSFSSLLNDPLEEAVWIGTFQYGINRFDLKKDTFIDFTDSKANADYQRLNLIRDAEKDTSGKVWVATYSSGLYFYENGKSFEKSFTHVTAANGLTSSSYYSIAADNKNRLWLLSDKGLSAVNDQGKYLYEAVQHPAVNFSNYATNLRYPKRIFFNAVKEELLVPVAGGLLLYYPNKKIPSINFPVVFTGITVGDKSMLYDSLFLNNQQIKIPYQSNSLSFKFAGLNYSRAGKMQYEYKLHQNDTQWKSLGNSNTVNFSSLSAGQYIFMVRAKEADGNISSNTASFSFYIQPPFWQTAWFYLLVAMGTACIMYMVYRYQLEKKLEVEKLRLRISRDLHDDIGSSLSSINVLSKVALTKGGSDMAIAGYLSKIKDAADHSMESMSDIVWAINPTNDTLEAIISRMKEFAADLCEAKEIELDFSITPELEKLSFDLAKRKNLYLLFKEAVNNAVKYSGCTLLKVQFVKPANKIIMTAIDNGRGFDATKLYTGNGLKSMKERAAACGGTLHIASLLHQGTIVTLQIPVTRFGVPGKA